MTKKYELTNIIMFYYTRTLHRIKALKDFGDVKAGDLGGWVEKEENLSQEGTCWVYGSAKVFGDAKVNDNARVYGSAFVFGHANIYGSADLFENAKVYGNTKIFGNAKVYGNTEVFGNAKVFGNTKIFGNARVYGSTEVFGNAKVYGSARIFGYAIVFDYAEVYSDSWVCGNARVFGDAEIHGNTKLYGNVNIFTSLTKTTDYLCLGPIGSRNDYVTFTKSGDEIYVATGCFKGTLEEFREAVKKTHGEDIHAINYNNTITYISNYFNNIHIKT